MKSVIDRAWTVRAVALAMPWYLDFLAVWMLNYERRRIEAMIREMCRSIGAFAQAWADRPQRHNTDSRMGTSADLMSAYLCIGAEPYQNTMHQHQLYRKQAQNQFGQHRSMIDGLFRNYL